MAASLIAFVCLAIVATSFLSGLFGMAGGMILVGVLILLLPLPAAMMLHAITQMASNGWRAVLWRRHVKWRTAGAYIGGCLLALAVWSLISFVPSKSAALVCLGLTPFMVYLLPERLAPDVDSAPQGIVYGFLCMTLMVLTGVAGPLLDSYFLGGKMDRRQIIATKGICQIFGHGLKLVYFGGVTGDVTALDPLLIVLALTATMIGTSLAKRCLEAISEAQFRLWARTIITAISVYYVAYGGYLWIGTA